MSDGKTGKNSVPLEMWRQIFDLAAEIKVIEPWKHYADGEIFAVELPHLRQTMYFGFIGKFGTCYGICGYVGDEGLRDYFRVCDTGFGASQSDVVWAMLEQNAVTCYFGDRETVPPSQKNIIKELGLKFRGRNAWTNFISYKTGLVPVDPDVEEVEMLIQGYRLLIPLLRHVLSGGVGSTIDFEWECPYCRLDPGTKSPEFSLMEIPEVDLDYPSVTCSDTALLKKLASCPKNPGSFLVDINYLPNMSVGDKGERPGYLLLFCIMDERNETLVETKLVQPGENRNVACLNGLMDFIFKNGRPKQLKVRRDAIIALLADVCERCKIPLDEAPDDFDAMDQAIDFISKGFS